MPEQFWEEIVGQTKTPFYFLGHKHEMSLRMVLIVLACNYICNLNIMRNQRCFDVCWGVEYCVVGYLCRCI